MNAIRAMNYEIPSTLLYSKGHVWAMVQNGAAVVGVTDYLQRELGTVINVEFSDSEVVERDSPIAWLESVKAIIPVPSPIDCEVIEFNTRLVREPWLVNASPYDEGWIAKLRALDLEELEKLQRAQAYIELISALSRCERYRVF